MSLVADVPGSGGCGIQFFFEKFLMLRAKAYHGQTALPAGAALDRHSAVDAALERPTERRVCETGTTPRPRLRSLAIWLDF